MLRFLLLILTLPQLAQAQEVKAARNLAPRSILRAEDLLLSAPLAPESLLAFLGKETRVALYRGRPITLNDLTSPALVERNDIVKLVYQSQGLALETEGKALGRAALDEPVRVMNLASKAILLGRVAGNARVRVEGPR